MLFSKRVKQELSNAYAYAITALDLLLTSAKKMHKGRNF